MIKSQINLNFYPRLKRSKKELHKILVEKFPATNHNLIEMVLVGKGEVVGVDVRLSSDDNYIYTGMGGNGEATTAPISFKSPTMDEWFNKVVNFVNKHQIESIAFVGESFELNVSVVKDDLPSFVDDKIEGELTLICVVPEYNDAGSYEYQAKQSAALFKEQGIQAKITLVDREGKDKWIVVAPESQFTKATKILNNLKVIPNWTEKGKISFSIRGSGYAHINDESINNVEIIDGFVLTQEQIDRYNKY